VKRKIGVFLFVTCLFMLLIAGTAQAENLASGKVGDVKWTFSSDHTLTLSGSGQLKASSTLPWKTSKWTYGSIYKIVIKSGVTAIGDNAFKDQLDVSCVTFASSVKSIGKEAFSGCRSLCNLTLNKGLESIGSKAFYRCIGMSEFSIPASVKTIGNGAFAGCGYLTAIKVNSSNKNFTSSNGILYSKDKTVLYACPGGKSVSTLKIPSTVTTIQAYAFTWCQQIEVLSIPASVTSISTQAFIDSFNLTYKVNSKNEKYASSDGALFNKKKTTLLAVPGNQVFYQVPSSVKKIGDYAFYSSSVRVAYLPEGVTTIGKEAFAEIGMLQISLPKSLTTIGKNAFAGVSSLTIRYCGTKTQWGKITKTGNDFSGCKLSYKYTDAKPSAAPKIALTSDVLQGYIHISWKAVKGASHYAIYRSTGKNGTYTLMGYTTETE